MSITPQESTTNMTMQHLGARMRSAAQVLALIALAAVSAWSGDCRYLSIFECPGSTGAAAVRS